jgi:dienelactone hydrolase
MKRGKNLSARLSVPVLWGVAVFAVFVASARAQTVVRFPTEDGMMIYGTLHLPKNPHPPFAGAVLFSEPEWIVRSTYDGNNIAPDLAEKHGMAVLTVDFRGTAGNIHKGRMFQTFSAREREKLQLDVRAAIRFLTDQDGVDPHRVALVAVGVGADYALREAAENPAVQGLVLISGTLSDPAREFIQMRSDIPILTIAGTDDKEGFREMSEALYLSRNKDSNMFLSTGHGTTIFSRTAGLADKVSLWIVDNVKGLGPETEISFRTEDGWSLHGKLRRPGNVDPSVRVPSVLLVHGAQHDQETYYNLSRALARRGFATLSFDWRGKNRDLSETRGHYGVNFPPEERANVYLDVKAGLNFLASQNGVDSNRIGVVAATLGTAMAIKGSVDDSRVKTMVMLSQYAMDDADKRFLTTTDIPIFFIASLEDKNTELGSLGDFTVQAHRMARNKLTELLLYDDAGRGSEMLEKKDELEGMIVRWFQDKLSGR